MSELPYREIPPAPERYTAGAVLGRLVDGLGFRYRWATEGLTPRDLAYRPDASARSGYETVDHVHNIVTMVHNAFTGERFPLPEHDATLPFPALRRRTLDTIRQISDRLKAADDDELRRLTIGFTVRERELDFPFWNAINGPIADAIHHVGQLVSFRRATGNPIEAAVDVFAGRLRGA